MSEKLPEILNHIPRCISCGEPLDFDIRSRNWYCSKCFSRPSVQTDTPGTLDFSEIQQVQRTVRITRFPEYEKRVSTLEDRVSNLEAIVERVNIKLDELIGEPKEEIVLRSIALKDALPVIQKYIEENPGCRTSDIVLNLQLDTDIVLKAIRTLREKGEVRSENIK